MAADVELGAVLNGRYRLVSTLGIGGMAIVYRATDLHSGRDVALKLLRADPTEALDERAAERFVREANHTARLRHAHLVEVYDVGRADGGEMYFVMEVLEGESLSERLRREHTLAVDRAVAIAIQVCEGLEVAHRANVVHRDLKPANVMLVQRDGVDDFVKVVDFGIAKGAGVDEQVQLTLSGMLIGTLESMAPEQIMGKPVDGRTDMYALGVMLYRMLTGQAPFRESTVPGLVNAHLNAFAWPMREIAPHVPGALDRVVLRCLAKHPHQRFESMAEVARALRLALDGIDARPGDWRRESERLRAQAGEPPLVADAAASDEVTLRDPIDVNRNDNSDEESRSTLSPRRRRARSPKGNVVAAQSEHARDVAPEPSPQEHAAHARRQSRWRRLMAWMRKAPHKS